MNLATIPCPGLALAPSAYASRGVGARPAMPSTGRHLVAYLNVPGSRNETAAPDKEPGLPSWSSRVRQRCDTLWRAFQHLSEPAPGPFPMAAGVQAAACAAEAVTVQAALPGWRPRTGGPLPQQDGAQRRLRVVAVPGDDSRSQERLRALLRRMDQGQAGAQLRVDVVCGHDRALRGTMQDLAARLRQVELRVHAYVADLPALFGGAELALLRASPQMLTEAVSAGTPVLAFDWQPHEAAQARLLSRMGCGLGSRDTETVAQALEGLSGDRRRLAQWTLAARLAADSAEGADFSQALFAHLAR